MQNSGIERVLMAIVWFDGRPVVQEELRVSEVYSILSFLNIRFAHKKIQRAAEQTLGS